MVKLHNHPWLQILFAAMTAADKKEKIIIFKKSA